MEKFRIKGFYNYYGGTFGAAKNGFLRDEYTEEFLEFDSKDAAEEYLKEIGFGKYEEAHNRYIHAGDVYYLHHGEAGAPYYKIYKFTKK